MMPTSTKLCLVAMVFAIFCFIFSIIISLIQFNILGWLFIGIQVGTFFVKEDKSEGDKNA